MFTVFVIIIIHSLYSIDVSCRYPNSVYGNIAQLNCLVNEATIKSANCALAKQVLPVCISFVHSLTSIFTFLHVTNS